MSDHDLLIFGYHKGVYRSEEEDIAFARRDNLSWKDITSYAETLPQHEEGANHLIRGLLGYPTQPNIHIPYVPQVRELMAHYIEGGLSLEELEQLADPVVRQIRNDDMEKNGWAVSHEFGETDYKRYDTELSAYKTEARNRLGTYLGYCPDLQYSLYAEISMRHFFGRDWFYGDAPFYAWDHRAAMIYQYRKAIKLYGLKEARQLPLISKQ